MELFLDSYRDLWKKKNKTTKHKTKHILLAIGEISTLYFFPRPVLKMSVLKELWPTD